MAGRREAKWAVTKFRGRGLGDGEGNALDTEIYGLRKNKHRYNRMGLKDKCDCNE